MFLEFIMEGEAPGVLGTMCLIDPILKYFKFISLFFPATAMFIFVTREILFKHFNLQYMWRRNNLLYKCGFRFSNVWILNTITLINIILGFFWTDCFFFLYMQNNFLFEISLSAPNIVFCKNVCSRVLCLVCLNSQDMVRSYG